VHALRGDNAKLQIRGTVNLPKRMVDDDGSDSWAAAVLSAERQPPGRRSFIRKLSLSDEQANIIRL
jgi:hypothetical protein